jgi:hypothetical protein
MNFNEGINTLVALYGMSPRRSVLFRGPHGIGKSSLVFQAASKLSKDLKEPIGVIDIRLGQYEVGDLIGLPTAVPVFEVEEVIFEEGVRKTRHTKIENVTTHELPQWFPRNKDYKGFLFFDEINRGTKDTMQWAFQIVLDYKTNFKSVPEGIQIVAACNDGIDYQVREFDPSFLDRFFTIDLRPTYPEFMTHAKMKGFHPAVIKFLEFQAGALLDPPKDMHENPDKTYPSRRSWEALSDTIKHFETKGINLLKDHMNSDEQGYALKVFTGWVGSAAAVDFQRYIDTKYKVFTAEQILDEFPRHIKHFKDMVVTDYAHYIELVIQWVETNKTLNKDQEKNLYEFLKVIPKETAVVFWNAFRTRCNVASEHWFRSQDYKKGGKEVLVIQSYLTKELLNGFKAQATETETPAESN